MAAREELRNGDSSVTTLDVEDLDKVAGGVLWFGEDAPDGHEMGCVCTYYKYKDCVEKGL